jgi:mannose-6-phosphate isomerase-like protein (cupin superfamily)
MLHMIFAALLAAAPSTGIEAGAAASTAACRPASLQIRVTDKAGTPLTAVRVTVQGISTREGKTDAAGCVTFDNMRAGRYMLRAERESFITLEKEFTISAERKKAVAASLSPAPEPVRVAAAPVTAGNPKVLSIPDLAERQLIAREPIKESPIGCSGRTDARLIQIREPLASHAHADADETLYVVAGEGTLRIGDEDRRVAPGWFSIIPRGTAHTVTRTGRNPIIVVSVLNGESCARPVMVAGPAR